MARVCVRLHMMAQQLNSGFITYNGFCLALRNTAESVTLSEKLLSSTKCTICTYEEHYFIATEKFNIDVKLSNF